MCIHRQCLTAVCYRIPAYIQTTAMVWKYFTHRLRSHFNGKNFYMACVYVGIWRSIHVVRRFWIVRFIFQVILSAHRISWNLQFHCHQIIIANVIVNGNVAIATALAAIATTTVAVVVWYKHNKWHWLCFQRNLCVCVCLCLCVGVRCRCIIRQFITKNKQ